MQRCVGRSGHSETSAFSSPGAPSTMASSGAQAAPRQASRMPARRPRSRRPCSSRRAAPSARRAARRARQAARSTSPSCRAGPHDGAVEDEPDDVLCQRGPVQASQSALDFPPHRHPARPPHERAPSGPAPRAGVGAGQIRARDQRVCGTTRSGCRHVYRFLAIGSRMVAVPDRPSSRSQ